MYLSDIKIVDLRFSVLNTTELDEAEEKVMEIKNKLSLFKELAANTSVEEKEKYKQDKQNLEEKVVVAKKKVEQVKKKYQDAKRNGEYDFVEKVYVDYYGEKEARPEFFFCWCRYDARNNYRELRDWKIMWQYSTVNVDTDSFWPEGVPSNESGDYVFGDLILVKRDLIAHLKDKLEERERSKGAGRAKLQEFQSKMEKYGAGIPASMVKEIMGG